MDTGRRDFHSCHSDCHVSRHAGEVIRAVMASGFRRLVRDPPIWLVSPMPLRLVKLCAKRDFVYQRLHTTDTTRTSAVSNATACAAATNQHYRLQRHWDCAIRRDLAAASFGTLAGAPWHDGRTLSARVRSPARSRLQAGSSIGLRRRILRCLRASRTVGLSEPPAQSALAAQNAILYGPART